MQLVWHDQWGILCICLHIVNTTLLRQSLCANRPPEQTLWEFKFIIISDKTNHTCLATDWSKHDIQFWLFQNYCSCHLLKSFCYKSGWKITLVGNRFTSGAESHYVSVEAKAFTLVGALDKACHFNLKCFNLIKAIEHWPLLKVFGDHCLDDISNSQLHNKKNHCYKFSIIHITGVHYGAADAISCEPTRHLLDAIATMTDATEPLNHHCHSLSSQLSAWPNRMILKYACTQTLHQPLPKWSNPSHGIWSVWLLPTTLTWSDTWKWLKFTTTRAMTVFPVPRQTRWHRWSHPLSQADCHPHFSKQPCIQLTKASHKCATG